MKIDKSMKEKIKIYIILVLIVGGLVGGFLIWQGYQKTERQYQACLNVCAAKYNYFDFPSERNVCIAECKEKYAK